MDQDQGGHGFQRVRTYLGPSLGWVEELVQPTTHLTTAGVYVVQPGDSVILVDVAAGVTIDLPDVRTWMQQTAYQPGTAFDRSLTIKDFGGNASNFNIVIAPFGQQTLDNIATSIVVSVSRSTVKLLPLNNLTGWITEIANVGGGTGGGGGDVFKAGNNTYTGINTFQNTVTTPTPAVNDSSNLVATTAWVTGKNYLTSASLTGYAPLFSPAFTGIPTAPTPGVGNNTTEIATTAFITGALTNYQPLDADLSAIAALTGTNVIYYRSSATVWSPVVIGGGLTFSGGVLASTAGGGNVSSSGTPVNGQIAQWVTSSQITGINPSALGYAPINTPVFTGNPQAPTIALADNSTSLATTAYVQGNLANFQPLDADLTSIAALTGTNTIYYRSGVATWSPVGLSGLSFSGGILTVTAGGGNVNSSGTPTVGQVAIWTDATHIQGQSASAAGLAPINSPAFTGTPTAPTPVTGDNSTNVATTSFVKSQAYAPLASPALTGTPTAPTQPITDNSTNIATTAYVHAYAPTMDALAYNGIQINGSMDVSQESGTGSTTANGLHVIDGWIVGLGGSPGVNTWQQTTDAPPGYSHSLLATVTVANTGGAASYAEVHQNIEGYRIVRLAWGTASAVPLSVGFWFKATGTGVTGNYCVTVANGANGSRMYTTTYNYPTAGTWQYVTVTIPGDTTAGAWASDNSSALTVRFVLQCGVSNRTAPNVWTGGAYIGSTGTVNPLTTIGNTFQVTGVTILPGTVVISAADSPYIQRSFDQELVICQRYYQKSYDYAINPGSTTSNAGAIIVYQSGLTSTVNAIWNHVSFAGPMRADPTVTVLSASSGASGKVWDGQNSVDVTAGINYQGMMGFDWTATSAAAAPNVNFQAHWVADARI